MCGIAGAVGFHKAIDKHKIKRMCDSIAHRGPDGEGFFFESGVGLGHRRLSIIDLETGAQPMTSTSGRYVITYNGEIYNYIELRQELEKLGTQFKTQSDTEVLLESYIKYGSACLSKLNGMYAFVIYDRESKKIFGARDEFGIKPFYYSIQNREFIFGSEIKALLQYLDHKPNPDYRAISDYLTFQYPLGTKTLFEGISRLEPGHYFEFDQSGFSTKAYWNLDSEVQKSSFGHNENWEELYFQTLVDSVKLRVRSDVPVGSHLSGGIDSASVCSVMSKELGFTNLPTFTAGFNEKGVYDDTSFAALTSKHLGTQHHSIMLKPSDFADAFQKFIWYMDEPMAGEGAIPQYFVSVKARENVKVVLGGQGADEHLAGYTRYLVLYLERLKAKEAGMGNTDVALNFKQIEPNLAQLDKYGPLIEKFNRANPNGKLDLPVSQRYLDLILLGNTKQLLSDDVQDHLRTQNYDSISEYFKLFDKSQMPMALNKMLSYDLRVFLPSLLHVEDRMSMAVGLESRLPFLDKRLVTMAFAMPEAVKFPNGITKGFLKKIVADRLPKEITTRKDKVGFPVPLNIWSDGPLKEFVGDYLGASTQTQTFLKTPSHFNNTSSFGRELWGRLCLESWARTFL